MIKKIFYIYFLYIFLGLSVSSSMAMDQDYGKKRSLCRKFNLSDVVLEDSLMTEASTSNKNEYQVPEYIFVAASVFYNGRRKEGEFGLLEYLFKMMPPEHRNAAFNFLNAWATPSDPTLAEFKGLKDRLMKLPYRPLKSSAN